MKKWSCILMVICGFISFACMAVSKYGVVGEEVTEIVDTGHQIQVWEILSEFTQKGTYRVSIKHAAKDAVGSFFITAWADTDGDGMPDKEIGRSGLKIANSLGEWSSWEFKNNYKRIFIGNLWTQTEEKIYYKMNGSLKGYSGLGDQVFYSKTLNQTPREKTGPRYTNIRFEILDGQDSGGETYTIDATKNCVHLNQMENVSQKAVKIKLATNTKYRLQLSGIAYSSQQTGYEEDPFPGVALFYATNEQDTFAMTYRVMKPGEVIEFTTPPSYPEDVFLLGFVMDYWSNETHRGEYRLTVEKVSGGSAGAGDGFSNPVNIDSRFVLRENKNINKLAKVSGVLQWVKCEYPWVAIEGNGNSKFQYYSFTVKPGAKAVFDVDHGFKGGNPGSVDLKIVLWDAQGNPIAGNDNLKQFSWYFGTDPGSKADVNGVDPNFEWTFSQGGTYIIGVAVTGDVVGNSGWKPSSTGLAPGDTFTLNISVENHEYQAKDSADYSDQQLNTMETAQ